MTDNTHSSTEGRKRGNLRALFWTIASLVIAAIFMVWAWNGAGVSLFDLPKARFVQIVSILIAFFAVLSVARMALTHGARH